MTKKLLKITMMAAFGAVISATAASAGILPGMDGGINPALIRPVSDSPGSFSPQSTQPTYTNMDALLGFRATSGTGATLDGIIDLGSVTQFNHTFTLSLGNIGAYMSANWGSDWYTRSDASGQAFPANATAIQWAVVATDTSSKTLWSTRDPGLQPTPWDRNANQGAGTTDIASVGARYHLETIAAGTNNAVVQTASNANSWASFQPPPPGSASNSFETWTPTDEANTSTVVPFDQIAQGTGAATTLGFFSWAADGTVTFTAVPEPSTYAMFALGGVLLGGLMFLRRRRAVRA
jgi:PEP-CTERM motif